jgi:serine O-acetyltransferase
LAGGAVRWRLPSDRVLSSALLCRRLIEVEGGVKLRLGPSDLWWLSCRAHVRRIPVLPRLLKFVNFMVYRAILPPEAVLKERVHLRHYGLGIVIHPNTEFGRNVALYHQVTIAAETWIGSPYRVRIGNNVLVGAGAKIVPPPDTGLVIGDNARIGANAVVTKDVPAGVTVAGVPARPLYGKSTPAFEHAEPASGTR